MANVATVTRQLVARRRRNTGLFALALAAPLAACGGATLDAYNLSAARPAPARALRAPVRVAEPFAGRDLDSDRILVRTGPQQMATLAHAKWPDRLPRIVQARMIQSFQNAGLAPQVGESSAAARYVLDLDIRKFELDVLRSRVEIDVAATLISPSAGDVATEDFTAAAAVSSTDPATVVAAMNGALSSVMKRIVAFVAARL